MMDNYDVSDDIGIFLIDYIGSLTTKMKDHIIKHHMALNRMTVGLIVQLEVNYVIK